MLMTISANIKETGNAFEAKIIAIKHILFYLSEGQIKEC